MLRLKSLYNFKGVCSLLLTLSILLSLFSFSAFSVSAEGVEPVPVVNTEIIQDEPIVDSDTTSEASLEQTNEYLRYITGFLLFIVLWLLIYAILKFFGIFF